MTTDDSAALVAHRQQYSALANKQYFNYGGQGPLAEPALAAIWEAYRKTQELGPFSVAVNGWVGALRQTLRSCMADQLGCPAEAISLTEDVTVGCNIPLWGQDWQVGDHILLSDCEHPGIIATVHELQRRFGLALSICPLMATLNGGDPAAIVAAHLRPNTRLVVLSHILWNTGQVLPLGDIMATCRRFVGQYPVRVLVDAAQSVGVLPLNLTELGVDYYAFTGHKWWCGPEGVGGLYVRPEIREALHPTYIGWRGLLYSDRGQPDGWQPNGQRYEVATSAYPLYAGLGAAIAFQNEWGNAQARYDRLCSLSAQLWQRLQQMPGVTCLRTTAAPESGLVSFQLASGKHAELVKVLEAQQIYVRQISDPNCVRACLHYLTRTAEIEALVAAIARFCATT